MNEATLHGYKVCSFMPVGQTEKFKVILNHGAVSEHIEIRKNDACPTEEVALARGLLLVQERLLEQDAILAALSKEAPVEIPEEPVTSTSKRWVIPERGLEGHEC